uniref:Uncharacterized protein n=1 Tax=Rhizophagus irregularis (strain DAOM 181602 / DAOM 197198 / MUCL 43194) TaxID=747089 RepID=U9UJ85_RHIID
MELTFKNDTDVIIFNPMNRQIVTIEYLSIRPSERWSWRLRRIKPTKLLN